MQFENEAPTYRVEVGREGHSHAFAIARRFGFPEHLLKRAQVLVGKNESERIQALERIDEEQARLTTLSRALQEERLANEAVRKKLDARTNRLQERAKQQIDESAKASVQQIRAIEEDVVALISRLQANPDLKSAGETLKAIREAKESITPKAPVPPRVDVGEVHPGDIVHHRLLDSKAKIVGTAKQGRVEIQVGSIQLMANLEDLRPAKNVKQPKPSTPNHRADDLSPLQGVRTPSNTLDLRGKRVDEAIEETDRFLDRKLLDGDRSVFILHGHGTGALKSAIRSWLGSNHNWRPLNESEGGDAFTLVNL